MEYAAVEKMRRSSNISRKRYAYVFSIQSSIFQYFNVMHYRIVYRILSQSGRT